MANLYEDFQPAIQAPFQQGKWGTAWGAAFGNVKDQQLERMKLGILARFPAFSPPDGISLIAAERQMVQGVDETLAHFIPRLENAWGAWSIGGTYWGLLAELAAAGYNGGANGSAYIVAANGYVYGPGDAVTVPDPINDVPGAPPGYLRLPPWYTFGGAATTMKWASHTAYALNQIVTPTTQPGTYFLCTQNGLSAGGQPTWPGPGGSVVDGSVTWTYAGNYNGAPYYPPWNFGQGDGQGAPIIPTVVYDGIDEAIGPGGSPSPDGSFWSRFIVMFDPGPNYWTNIVNPPTATSAPSSGELSVISEIIAKFKPGKSSCVGILVMNPSYTRACWGWPLTTTPHIPESCWLSRAIVSGDVDAIGDFEAQNPQTVNIWLANTTFPGQSFVYLTPSSAWENANTPTLMLFEATGASAGPTGFFEPVWPTTIGATVTDNGITWKAIAKLYRWGDYAGDTDPDIGHAVFAF